MPAKNVSCVSFEINDKTKNFQAFSNIFFVVLTKKPSNSKQLFAKALF